MKIKILFVVAVAMAMFSCKKDDDKVVLTPYEQLTQNLVKINSNQIDGYTLNLFASENLFVGYNNLYMILTDANGEIVRDLEITMNPMMNMGMMNHTTPFELPYLNNSQGRYRCDMTFIMPSTAGDWTLGIDIELIDESILNFEFDLVVVEKDESQLISFESDLDEAKVFIALVSPKSPEVGHNTFELAVYTRESMMSFPAMDNLIIEMEPEMPAMGHGSPNNENPLNTDNGHYVGLVNFTMTGLWEIHLEVFDEDDNLMKDDISFEITF